MKKIRLTGAFGLLLCILMTSQGCSSFESYIPYEGVIRRASEVKMYKVQPTATAPASQAPGTKYVGNYEVAGEVPLSPEQQKQIKDLVLDEGMYVEEEVKSCLHKGQYALSFEYKGVPDLTVVVSMSPCSKAYVTDKSGAEELLELPLNNELEALLSSFGK